MKKAIVITLAVIGGLALTCVGAMVIGGIWIGSNAGPPEGITTSVSMPSEVAVGDAFQVTIEIENTLNTTRTLKDIDFYDPLLKGVRVVSTDPSYQNYDGSMGFATYSINAPIDPLGSLTVTFDLVAETAGEYRGDVDVSVDSLFSFTTEVKTLRIRSADAE